MTEKLVRRPYYTTGVIMPTGLPNLKKQNICGTFAN